jgi:hypothetical protein
MLMQKMEAHLPIPAQATSALVRTLRASAVKISSKQRMQIDMVVYLGDEGGIACGLKVPGQEDTAVVVSLTHLRLPSTHPLAPDVACIPNRPHEEISPRSLSPAHHRALVRAGGDIVDTLPGRSISPNAGGGVLGAAPALARGRASQEGAMHRGAGARAGGGAKPGVWVVGPASRPGQHLTRACKRPPIAFARSSLRPLAAPEA